MGRDVVADGQREFGGAEGEIDFRVVRKAKLKADAESGYVREGTVALVAEDVRLAVHVANPTSLFLIEEYRSGRLVGVCGVEIFGR